MKRIAIIAVLLMLQWVVPAQARDPEFVVPPTADAMTYDDVKKLFRVKEVRTPFKQHKRLLIGNYRVAFSVARSVYAREDGGQSTDYVGQGFELVRHYKDQEMRATVELTGLSSADLQAIAQVAFEDLQARLAATGREVITMNDIEGSAALSEMETNPLDENGEYWTHFGIGPSRELVMVAFPEGYPAWFFMGDLLDAGGGLKAAGNALRQKNFGFIKAIGAEQNAGLIDISVQIRFADAWSQRSKMLRKAKVGVVPGMKLQLVRGGLTTVKSTPMGVFPGPAGSLSFDKKIGGFDLGTDFADYNRDVSSEENWSTVGETIELEVATDPDRFGAAVLKGLKALNAAIALTAAEYPAR